MTDAQDALARALPEWMVEHPLAKSENELRGIISSNLLDTLRRDGWILIHADDLELLVRELDTGNTFLYRHPGMPTGQYTALVEKDVVLALIRDLRPRTT